MPIFPSEREAREYAERVNDLHRRVARLQTRLDSIEAISWDPDYPYFAEIAKYNLAQPSEGERKVHEPMKNVAAKVSCFVCFTWALITTGYVLSNDANFTKTFFFQMVLPGLIGFLVFQVILYVASNIVYRQGKVEDMKHERDAALNKLHRIGLAVEQERVQGYRDNAGGCDGIINEIKEILK